MSSNRHTVMMTMSFVTHWAAIGSGVTGMEASPGQGPCTKRKLDTVPKGFDYISHKLFPSTTIDSDWRDVLSSSSSWLYATSTTRHGSWT